MDKIKVAKELMKLAKNLVANSHLQKTTQRVDYLCKLLDDFSRDCFAKPLQSKTNLDPILIAKSIEGIENYCNKFFPLITKIFNPLQNVLNDIDNKVIQKNMVDIQVVGRNAQQWSGEIDVILVEIQHNYK